MTIRENTELKNGWRCSQYTIVVSAARTGRYSSYDEHTVRFFKIERGVLNAREVNDTTLSLISN